MKNNLTTFPLLMKSNLTTFPFFVGLSDEEIELFTSNMMIIDFKKEEWLSRVKGDKSFPRLALQELIKNYNLMIVLLLPMVLFWLGLSIHMRYTAMKKMENYIDFSPTVMSLLFQMAMDVLMVWAFLLTLNISITVTLLKDL